MLFGVDMKYFRRIRPKLAQSKTEESRSGWTAHNSCWHWRPEHVMRGHITGGVTSKHCFILRGHKPEMLWTTALSHAVNISTHFVQSQAGPSCQRWRFPGLKCWLWGKMLEGYLTEDTAGWLIRDNLGFLASTGNFLQLSTVERGMGLTHMHASARTRYSISGPSGFLQLWHQLVLRAWQHTCNPL